MSIQWQRAGDVYSSEELLLQTRDPLEVEAVFNQLVRLVTTVAAAAAAEQNNKTFFAPRGGGVRGNGIKLPGGGGGSPPSGAHLRAARLYLQTEAQLPMTSS